MIRKILLIFMLTGALVARGADFMLVDGKKPLRISFDKGEKPVVGTAVDMLCGDIRDVSGVAPAVGHYSSNAVIAGTLGVNRQTDSLVKARGIDVGGISGAWETFLIVNLGDGTLAVIGSDARGTAYGLLELSRMAGVSPWVWWADVTPDKKKKVAVPSGFRKADRPAVQYRGIFINDEDWGIMPWSWKSFEPSDTPGRIGPKTYSKIFELLLRLRANAIWPAMHEKTVPFYMVQGNKEAAEKYGIVVGTSHCEPLMRNNAGEWDAAVRGPFNFLTNKQNIVKYWVERLDEVRGQENIYTIGMRGVHDGKMEGVNTVQEYKDALVKVLATQRELLAAHVNPDVERVPQALIPYKEVLEVYDAGLEVPQDVTLVWCDDNYGYLTRVSNEQERKRAGGSGIYYHISYWGRPHDYLWLCSTAPAQIYNQMRKAWDNGAQKLWILNVGDIKPAEYDIEFFMDMAWNPASLTPATVPSHLKKWLEREFGALCAEDIYPAMSEYYALANVRKPEHMGWSQVEVAGVPGGRTPVKDTDFNPFAFGDQIKKRIDRYKNMEIAIEKAAGFIPENRLAAFFQLVEYPVYCASAMNKKLLYAQKARLLARHGLPVANAYMYMSDDAYQTIARLTESYNKGIAGGKWDLMMDMHPRNLPVFDPPKFDSMLDYDRKDGRNVVWFENHAEPAQAGSKIFLPAFVKEADNTTFMMLYSKNMRKPLWKIEGAPLWLNYREDKRNLRDEIRVTFSVNHKLVTAANAKGSCVLTTGGQRYYIHVEACQAGVKADAYEANQVVSLDAADFKSGRAEGCEIIPGLGHSGRSVAIPKGASIEYDIYTFNASAAHVRAYLLPNQAIDGGDVRVAMSIDSAAPAELSIKTGFRSEIWKQNVLRNQAIVEYDHKFDRPGLHTLRVTALDDNVVLDRLTIDFGMPIADLTDHK